MMKKSVLLLVAVVFMTAGGLAYAQDAPAPNPAPQPGYGPGYGKGPGGGPGQGWNQGPMAKFRQDPQVNRIRTLLQEKQREMISLMQASPVDEGRIKSLHQEIIRLRNQLADKRLEMTLAFKKENPEWSPRPGKRGRGQGRGGPGWRNQQFHGPRPGTTPPAGAEVPQNWN